MDLRVDVLLRAYRSGAVTPNDVVEGILTDATRWSGHGIWIVPPSRELVDPFLARLTHTSPHDLPLYGIPFAIKDNIDLAHVPTTMACQERAFTPSKSAFVVQRLIDAGAIPVGKTNMDQFATGLSGTRSPYGATHNVLNPAWISGGSSSGSAVAVAAGLASFALGTDTAGSGRVPAALNGLVGVKPSRGLVSTTGVFPACRSLDCVSIFALTVDDASRLLSIVEANDGIGPYACTRDPLAEAAPRSVIGVPAGTALEFFGDDEARVLFERSIARLKTAGGTVLEIDFAPFLDAARLLYEGPWVAERALALQEALDTQPDVVVPAVRAAVSTHSAFSASDVFAAMHRLQHLKHRTDDVFTSVDCIVTPTVGTTYTIEAMLADPLRLNARLGHYTNFMNLLDYAAIAVPAGVLEGRSAWGITLFGPRLGEETLFYYSRLFLGTPSTTRRIGLDIAVCGAHLEGMPLNHQLVQLGATLVRRTVTAPAYRLFVLAGGPPERPGLVRDTTGAGKIDVEVWNIPLRHVGTFLAGVPHPLGIGTVELADGRWVKGFVCEPSGLAGAREITHLGGWRAFVAPLSGIT